jgi:TRAP-type C4-dicarboxylate transport system permease small subunit
MKRRYVQAMGAVHRLCMVIAGACLVVITLIIPWGVFTRYVLNRGSSWPEPMAVLLMIWFSFLAAALCYRDNLHISVNILPSMLRGTAQRVIGWAIELLMAAANLFILIWGTRLVETTWYQAVAEFPIISVGVSYLPVPIGGAIIVLFVIERLWTGRLFATAAEGSLSPTATD